MSIRNDKIAILIITLILFALTLIGVLLYSLSPKVSLGASNAGKNISRFVDFTVCQNDSSQNSCLDEKYIDDKKIRIRYDKMQIKSADEEPTGATLYINDKEIISPKSLVYRIDNSLYITESTVLLATYEANVKNIKVYIYDFRGNKLTEIYELDRNNGIIVVGYRFENNKVILTGNKHIVTKTVFVHLEDDKYIFENADLCQEYIANETLKGNDIYKAEYELEYITNNKVSNINLIPGSEVTLIDHLKGLGCSL